jgi:hypothetical protein
LPHGNAAYIKGQLLSRFDKIGSLARIAARRCHRNVPFQSQGGFLIAARSMPPRSQR